MRRHFISVKLVFLLMLVFYLIGNYVFGDTPENDSLLNELRTKEGKARISILLELGKNSSQHKPYNSIEYYKEALNLETEKKSVADINYSIAVNYMHLKQPDSSSEYYDNSIQLWIELNDSINIMKGLTMKGLMLQKSGEFGSSVYMFSQALKTFKAYWKYHSGDGSISEKHLATIMTNYSISLNKIGQYDSSLYYSISAYEIKEKLGQSESSLAQAKVNIGYSYLLNNRNKESIKYFSQSMNSFIKLKDTFNLLKCFNNIGLAYKQMGDTTKAIEFYNKALDINRLTNSGSGTALNLINLSGLFSGQGKYTAAESSLNEALKLSLSENNKQYVSTVYQNLSSLYLNMGKLKKALIYSNKSAEIIKQTGELKLLEENLLNKSNIFKAMKDFEQALEYHQKYSIIHDSIYNLKNNERFNQLQATYETYKKEQEINSLMQEKENNILENKILKQNKNAYAATLVFVVLIFSITFYLIYLKRKKDKQIHHQKELFLKKEKELTKAELEKSRLKEEELKQSLIYKSKQLSTHALHMMQKNTMLNEIQTELKRTSKKVPVDDKPNYKNILNKIKLSLRSHKDWDVFKLYFEDVNRNFYNKLKEINSGLTTNDQRLCALIKLNMNSKEMASVLNVAPNSIKSSRYRLKKKLGLDVEADLEEFIRDLS